MKWSSVILILTKRSRSFQSICVIETILSDFHSTTISVMKTHVRKPSPKIISYKDCTKQFHEKTESVTSCYNNGHFVSNLIFFFKRWTLGSDDLAVFKVFRAISSLKNQTIQFYLYFQQKRASKL